MNKSIKNIIFDFGDIFIDLDKPASMAAILEIAPEFTLDAETTAINMAYEKGELTTDEFVAHYKTLLPAVPENQLKAIWNAIILEMPEYRVDFLEELRNKGQYRLFLLSNTNSLHMEKVLENCGDALFNRFRGLFDQFYLSHEIGLRKPDREIYEFVLTQNDLHPEESLFIDDLEENTRGAEVLGIHTWNLQPGKEDITELFTKNLPF